MVRRAIASVGGRAHGLGVSGRRARLAAWDAAGVRRMSSLLLVGVVVAVGFTAAAGAFFVLPNRLVDDARFRGAGSDVTVEEKRLKARDDVRTAGVQFLGALALIVGGALTWRTVWLTREGQITDRLAKAIEQLGDAERRNVRVGAIYALGRVARDSRADHAEVMALLGEHLRTVAPAVGEDGRRLELDGRRGVDPEVRAVAMVLRERRARWDPKDPRLNFSGIDFRNAPLQGVSLRRADLRRSNFRGAYISDAELSGARLDEATLWGTNLQRARLEQTSLAGADLRYAHAEGACLRAAELDEVLWGATELQRADLRGATGMREGLRNSGLVSFDERTRWPRA
jgi:Pentapeptide repeats (8 copies)